MIIRIGLTNVVREVELEMAADSDHDTIIKEIEKAAHDRTTMLWLSDKRGRKVGVPVEKIAYVDIGSADDDRSIGFGQ